MPDNSLRAQIKLKIAGTAQTDMLDDLIAVTVDSNLHLPAMLTVELFDDDLKWVNSTSIDLGKALEVTFEEQPEPDSSDAVLTKVLFLGEITSIEPHYNKDGRAT